MPQENPRIGPSGTWVSTHEPQPGTRRNPSHTGTGDFVYLAPWVFRISWFGLLALHLFCAAYFAVIGGLYWTLPSTYLDVCLAWYRIGMSNTHYPMLAIVHVSIASLHSLLAVLMVIWSLWRRRWCFGPLQELGTRSSVGDAEQLIRKQRPRKRAVFATAWAYIFGRQGLLGVESPHFDLILMVRELSETALQTLQGYRMSQHLPRIWLNRFYVGLIVLNCWLNPMIHRAFSDRPMTRRMLCLLCDVILDLMSAVGIPLVLLLAYAPDYNSVDMGFAITYWYNDEWMVNATNEFQVILVNSWSDLASRILFSIGLIGCIESIKDVLREVPSSVTDTDVKRIRIVSPGPVSSPRQIFPSPNVFELAAPKPSRSVRLMNAVRRIRSRWGWRLHSAAHVVFAVWGLVVFGVHILAESKENLTNCLMQIRPWLTSQPACALISLDCHRDGMNGGEASISSLWESVDASSVNRVYIRHCPQLTMPTAIRKFSFLAGMKIYNSTIRKWDEESELTSTTHPYIILFLGVRVNTSDGHLPSGLLSSDFPPTLTDIEFCVTNIAHLPDNLDEIWPIGCSIYLEYAMFDAFPPVLSRLAPYMISFAGNHFTEFPFEAFQVDGLVYFNIGANPYQSLVKSPYEDITDIGSIEFLYITDINISVIPRWLDQLILRFYNTDAFIHLIPARTPFCDNVSKIKNGSLPGFPESSTGTEDELSFVMFMNRSEIDTLVDLVNCRYVDTVSYPLAFEDRCSGIK